MTGASDSQRRFMPRVAADMPAGERPMIAVVRAVPGHEDELASAIRTLTAAVRGELGCREFRPLRRLDDPGTFYLYEIYADVDAFRAHLGTPHVAAFFAELERHSTSDASALTQLIELDVPQ